MILLRSYNSYNIHQSKSMYIRAKREKTILFLCIETSKLTVDQIKTKLCEALDNGKTKDDVRLLVEGKKEGEYTLLESVKSLENSDVVYFVYLNQGKVVFLSTLFITDRTQILLKRSMGIC